MIKIEIVDFYSNSKDLSHYSEFYSRLLATKNWMILKLDRWHHSDLKKSNKNGNKRTKMIKKQFADFYSNQKDLSSYSDFYSGMLVAKNWMILNLESWHYIEVKNTKINEV